MTDLSHEQDNIARRVWSALDGDLVLRFEINRDLSIRSPSDVTIITKGGFYARASESSETIWINSRNWTEIAFTFDTGVAISGRFKQNNNVLINEQESIGIFVDIEFGYVGQEAHYFEGIMVYCPMGNQPYPPSPTPSGPTPPSPPYGPGSGDKEGPASPVPTIVGPREQLFPYVYIRKWSELQSEEFAFAFIRYAVTSPPDGFIHALAQATSEAQRTKIALDYVNGSTPYQGEFLAFPELLDSPVAQFNAIARDLHQTVLPSQEWLEAANFALVAALDAHDESAGYYFSLDYRELIERAWQTYSALIVLNQFSQSLRNDMARILFVAHIVETAFTEADGALSPLALSDEEIEQLREAMILLPGEGFEKTPKIIRSDGSWALPAAIGDLQLARRRLRGYAPGEIARIENIMPGARREVRNRELQQNFESDEFSTGESTGSQWQGDDERTSLQSETRRILGEETKTQDYQDYDTTYGPPTTATLTGKVVTTTGYPSPAQAKDASRFARRIVNNSLANVSRSVKAKRVSSTLSESEQVVSNVVDNSQGQSSIQAAYRWVNKIYEAQVINYGRRLMMEFSLRNPAKDYIDNQAGVSGHNLTKPLSPQQAFGIESFKDITRENFPTLCAAYNVTDIPQPPAKSIIIGTTLRGDDEQQLTVPRGYRTIDAKADCTSVPAGQSPPPVLVGNIRLTGGTKARLPRYGDGESVPVSSAAPTPALVPLPEGSPPSSPVVTTFLTNVELRCRPTSQLMNEWKASIFRAVTDSYQSMLSHYYSQLQDAGAYQSSSLNPLYERDVERSQIEAECVGLMIDCLVKPDTAFPSSSPPEPETTAIYRSHIEQFLGSALEWREMAYSFTSSSKTPQVLAVPESPGVEQASQFTRFLQAESARVLVPVCPQHLHSFLYFWSSGQVWEGPDWLVPVFADDVAVIVDATWHSNDYGEIENDNWPIWVPTAMQVLDDGNGSIAQLPMFCTEDQVP